MKIHFLTFTAAVLMALGASAQLTPKSYVIGGGFSLAYAQSNSNPTNYSQFNLSLAPTIGKFVNEKWLIEGGVGYGLSSFKNILGSPYNYRTSHSVSLSVGATRYIPISERFYFTVGGFISPRVGMNSASSDNNGTIVENNYSVYSGDVYLTPGLTYFINKKWMLFTQFGALKYSASTQSNSNTVLHNVSMNLNSSSFLVGFRYVLGGNK